jgi:hypothetical protein
MNSNYLKAKFNSLIKNIQNLNYEKYYKQNNLNKIYFAKKFINIKYNCNYIFNNFNKSYDTQILDLIRLHFIVRFRKILTVLELGCGTSTLFIASALALNKEKFFKQINNKLRNGNKFQLYSVDSNYKYINKTKKNLKNKKLDKNVFLSYSSANITNFNGEITSELKKLPNINPDLIYIDGPHCLDVKGKINGISFNHIDRTLTACDILKIENQLKPSTILLIDGLTNYANFLKNNLKRNWQYARLDREDISLFQLCDDSLGYINDAYLKWIYKN